MSKVVGIDLGTTNTVVAVVSHGQASALADEHGDKLIPSVVSFHPNGNVLVGRPAKERRLVDPRNTIYSVKRLIGRSWDSEEVRRARTRFPFEMREGPGQAALVVARNETYTLPEISAFVLRKAKAAAEAALGSSIERAVITVPANFNDLQRAATKVAGRVAGLEVMRILNEPTAAALAYGYGKSTSERLAVYDFGGGTFDVTLLDLSDNVFEVLATAGNTFLGGDDIDLMIAEKMSEEFLAAHRYDPRSDPLSFEKLRAAAETVKTRLSLESSVTLEVAEVAHGPGGRSLDLSFAMTRSELERLIAPLVDKTFDVCREALGIARLQSSDFDHVLLVGGSSRIPLVRRRVEEFFKQPLLSHISPDEVVAIGAAIQASALTGAERRRAEVPPAPRPGARVDTQPGHRAAAEGRGRFDTNPFGEAMSSARGRLDTAQGLNPGTGAEARAGVVRPVVVPSPEGPSDAAPVTADRAERRRQTTGMGLGQPPAHTAQSPSAAVPQTTGPHTDAGLGPRGRVRTGAGLGPAAEEAQAQTTAAPQPFIVPPVERAGLRPLAAAATSPQVPAATPARTVLSQQSSTLLSAREAAAKAKAEADRAEAAGETDLPMPLPMGGMDDSQIEDATRPTSGDPPTSPWASADRLPQAKGGRAAAPRAEPARAGGQPMAPPTRAEPLAPPLVTPEPGRALRSGAELTPAAVAAKYGNLPLILPSQARSGEPGAAVAMPRVRADDEPTVSGAQADRERARLKESARGAERVVPAASALARPGVTEDSVAEVSDEDLELLTNEPALPAYSDLRSLAMDEPTRARAAPTSPGLRQREDDLPIPAIPAAILDDGDEEDTTTGASIEAAAPWRSGKPSADSGSLPQVVTGKATPGPRAPAWGSVPTPAPMSRAKAEELFQRQLQGPLPPAPTPPPYAPQPQAAPLPAYAAPLPAPAAPPPAYAQPPAPAAPALPSYGVPQPAAYGAPPGGYGPAAPSAGGTAPFAAAAAPFAAAAAAFAAVAPQTAPLDYQAPSVTPPLLVDVTPLSLAVETVSGFCDTLIERNTPVPCERTRDFVTAMDNQTVVRVRISQGESQRFIENTLLGELELAGLPPAPRGQIQVAVSFALDTDGILSVSAREVATGRATQARVRLVGLPEPGQVEQMRVRHATQPVV